jgi:pimeloyl-ACP methyl ester carboxylesterase
MYSTVRTVRSADGTMIAYEEVGAGPRLVLIHGSICDRTYWAPVVPALKEHLTVVSVDRRGRGGSGDTAPYASAREVEDVVAVVEAFDEPVHLLGHSYGGILALEAAVRTDNLRTLSLFEPTIGQQEPTQLLAQLDALLAEGDRETATALFMREVGLPDDAVAELRTIPEAWQPMVDCAHTIPREVRSGAAFRFDAARYAALDVPTVLLAGTESPAELGIGVGLVQGAVAGARTVTMPGVDHEAVTTGPQVLVDAILGAVGGEVAR